MYATLCVYYNRTHSITEDILYEEGTCEDVPLFFLFLLASFCLCAMACADREPSASVALENAHMFAERKRAQREREILNYS